MSLECGGVVMSDPVTGAAYCCNEAPSGALVTGGCATNSVTPVAFTYDVPFDITQLDLTQAGESFAAAVVIVGTMWAIGKAVSLILSVVRR
jgi:hypothetical protein